VGTSTVYTVGHSTRPLEELLGLLEEAGVRALVDVRSVPRSQRNPQFEGRALERALAQHGISYAHERDLGGFRRPRPGSPNGGWHHPAFAGYADHMASAEFAEGLARVEALAGERPTSVMCAEAQWWRCHRRLIADALVARGWRVLHLGLGGGPAEHELTPFAHVARDGTITYPPAQGELPLPAADP
jgi:uncharacterized protein (DUF488 family)